MRRRGQTRSALTWFHRTWVLDCPSREVEMKKARPPRVQSYRLTLWFVGQAMSCAGGTSYVRNATGHLRNLLRVAEQAEQGKAQCRAGTRVKATRAQMRRDTIYTGDTSRNKIFRAI